MPPSDRDLHQWEDDGGPPSPADTSLTESYLAQHGAAWDDPESVDLDDEE